MTTHVKNTTPEPRPQGRVQEQDFDFDFSDFLKDEDESIPMYNPLEEEQPEPEIEIDLMPEEQPPVEKTPVEKAPPVRERPSAKKSANAPKKKPAPAKKGKGGAKKGKKKKKDRFRARLRVYLIILAVLIVAVLAALWVILANAQKKIDAENAVIAQQRAEQAAKAEHERAVYRAPQLAFEAWLAGTDAADWAELWCGGEHSALEPVDRVTEQMAAIFDGAEPFKSLDYTAEKPIYVIKNGETALARITLTGSELTWSVENVEFLLQGDKKASVRVASGSRVYCNGTELGEEYIIDSSSNFTNDSLRDKLVNPVTWDTYEVSGLLFEPELRADAPEGGVVTETAQGDFLLCLDAEAGETYRTRAVNFVKAYLNYYMSGYNGTQTNLYKALGHLAQGYQAYKDLQDTYNGVVWNTAYANIDTSKTEAGDVVIWADNCYSVDVTYNADCTLNGQAIDYADATMRIYFLQTNNGYVISNFETL